MANNLILIDNNYIDLVKNTIRLANTYVLSKSNDGMTYHEFDFIECYDDDDYDFDDDE